MGLDTTFGIYAGVTIPFEDFKDRGYEVWKFDERNDDLVANRGWELSHDEVVIGIPIVRFSQGDNYSNDHLESIHSLDLAKKLEDKREDVKQQLADLGIEDRRISLYIITDVL